MKTTIWMIAAGTGFFTLAGAPISVQGALIEKEKDFSSDIHNASSLVITVDGLTLNPGESVSSLSLNFSQIGADITALVPASTTSTVVSASMDVVSVKFYTVITGVTTNLKTITLTEDYSANGGINVVDLLVPASATDTVIDQGNWVQSSTGVVVLNTTQLNNAGLDTSQPFSISVSVRLSSDYDSTVDFAGTFHGHLKYTYETAPEPASVAGLACGLAGLALLRKRS